MQRPGAQGATKVGILGFCWGGCMALEAAGEGEVDAAAAVHPAFFGKDKVRVRAMCGTI